MDSAQDKTKGLTIDKLRQYKGLEHLTNEQAERIVASIKKFCRILLKVARGKKASKSP